MADEALDDMDGAGDGPEKKRVSGKRLIIFAAIIVLFLVGGGVGAAFMLGLFGGSEPPPAEAATEGEAAAPAAPPPPQDTRAFFFEVPDLIVNLNTNGRKSTFLKIKIALELEGPQDTDRINEVLPRIVDNFQVYLRELRVDDLNGSAGMYRLREELLRRVNLAARPVRVRDVLFKEMLVQ
ncbi:flagellar basal body-associated FliL family protein [Thalassobaculum salexigens]|uniref:flagellar basal body-associated FliL family protein n=1 Tax=Thalassobaculum salexigens TaxID=455360 RepID=UPI00248E8ABC|nr:flagellar basal body-associated FliL family protein [Thalassobaculum salexigens]